MKKILWLTSWYPNKTDMFTGDFIQRHAKAAALYDQITVLHVAKAEEPFFDGKTSAELIIDGNLYQHIVYFKCDIAWKPLNKIVSFINYIRIFRKLIPLYLKDKPSLAHVHVPLKAGLLALWVKKKYNIPYVLTEHYGIYNKIVDEPYAERNFLFRYFTKKIINEAAAFSPVSKYIGDSINEMVLAKPYKVIYNDVDTSVFNYQHNAIGKFRFIHVSNMIPLKNAEGIIRTIARLWAENKNLELILVGPHDNSIYKLVENTSLLNKAIFFTGELSYPDVANQMQQAHSLILFSKMENMPCVILEALCCGLPVIATNVGGIPEVINLSNGILVESEDEKGLQNAISKMMNEYDIFNRAEISKKAISKFSYEAIGKEIRELYDQSFS